MMMLIFKNLFQATNLFSLCCLWPVEIKRLLNLMVAMDHINYSIYASDNSCSITNLLWLVATLL